MQLGKQRWLLCVLMYTPYCRHQETMVQFDPFQFCRISHKIAQSMTAWCCKWFPLFEEAQLFHPSKNSQPKIETARLGLRFDAIWFGSCERAELLRSWTSASLGSCWFLKFSAAHVQRPGHERLQGLTRLKKVHEIFCLKHVEQFSLCCTSSISFNLKVFFWVVWKLNYLVFSGVGSHKFLTMTLCKQTSDD